MWLSPVREVRRVREGRPVTDGTDAGLAGIVWYTLAAAAVALTIAPVATGELPATPDVVLALSVGTMLPLIVATYWLSSSSRPDLD